MKYMILMLMVCACGSQNDVINNISPNDTFLVAGAITQNAAGQWILVNDDGHAPVNIDRIEVMPDHIQIVYSRRASKAISFTATIDNDFVPHGVFVGVSMGVERAHLYFSEIGPNKKVIPKTPASVSKGGSVFMMGVMYY